jgi:glycosyltransferase involved in cell wall biosynthesis
MHVAQVSFFVDPQCRPPETLLHDWSALVEVAVAARSAGARVTVLQASLVAGRVMHSDIAFHFVRPGARSALARSCAFRELLRDLSPDVFHVHGLGFAPEVCELRAAAPHTPILLQDHADRVPRFWRRRAWRRAAATASGISFCAKAQAEPFRNAGLLPPGLEILEVPESTSSFTPGDAAEARAATGLYGDPAVLWVGHLDANKDPLTVLEGVSAALHERPNLHLWCCYATSQLLPALEARLAREESLRRRVHLLGRVPHESVEQLMRAADFFVLGSHREGGSFALIEAMATGLTPVVTDIPSSRSLTGNTAVGTLWPRGDWRALAAALQRAPAPRAFVRAHFDEHLSSSAIGRKLVTAYSRVLAARAGHVNGLQRGMART